MPSRTARSTTPGTSRLRATPSVQASRARGLTIVEMLAVIGIIGILMSLVVPTISGIRKEALSVSCQSNLRQLFTGFDTYRATIRGQLPMCDFLPASTPEGPQGGLVSVLGRTLGTDNKCWFCPADDDEDGSIAAGTSYVYMPGLLRYTPQVQIPVASLMATTLADMSLTARQRERMRLEAESRLVGALYERSPMGFPVINDSQDRHKIGDRNPRNAVYIDGSVSIMRDLGTDEDDGGGDGGGGSGGDGGSGGG
jgi:prepilin-type N-terminal cleavage/methylation domain-containing protein